MSEEKKGEYVHPKPIPIKERVITRNYGSVSVARYLADHHPKKVLQAFVDIGFLPIKMASQDDVGHLTYEGYSSKFLGVVPVQNPEEYHNDMVGRIWYSIIIKLTDEGEIESLSVDLER